MMIKTKRRNIVKWLDTCIKENPKYTRGVPLESFRSFLFDKVFHDKNGLNKNVYYDGNDLVRFTEFCIQDGFIINNVGLLQISSNGEEFIGFWHYSRKFLNYSITQHILNTIIALVLGYIIGHYVWP